MTDERLFRVGMPLRCFHRDDPLALLACGAPAGWFRPSVDGKPIGYYCDRHTSPGDQRVPSSYVVTRVSLRAELVFNGTSFGPTPAKLEALERVRELLESAGGVLNVLRMEADFGRYVPQAPAGKLRPAGGSPE